VPCFLRYFGIFTAFYVSGAAQPPSVHAGGKVRWRFAVRLPQEDDDGRFQKSTSATIWSSLRQVSYPTEDPRIWKAPSIASTLSQSHPDGVFYIPAIFRPRRDPRLISTAHCVSSQASLFLSYAQCEAGCQTPGREPGSCCSNIRVFLSRSPGASRTWERVQSAMRMDSASPCDCCGSGRALTTRSCEILFEGADRGTPKTSRVSRPLSLCPGAALEPGNPPEVLIAYQMKGRDLRKITIFRCAYCARSLCNGLRQVADAVSRRAVRHFTFLAETSVTPYWASMDGKPVRLACGHEAKKSDRTTARIETVAAEPVLPRYRRGLGRRNHVTISN